MPRRTRGGTIHEADNTNIIQSVEDVPEERKDQYLKRLKKEDETNKQVYKKSDSYIEVVGKKVLIKFKNAAGSVYTRYWFNVKRHPDKFAEIRKNKGAEIDGVFVRLK